MNKFLKWLDNYWYHYKWHTLAGIFVAVFLIITSIQMFGKQEVDVYVMYAGPKSFTPTQITEIQDAFEDLIPDMNDDGDKVVQFVDITLLTDKQLEIYKQEAEAIGEEYKPDMQFVYDMWDKYKVHLAGGDAYLLLLDPEVYAKDYDFGMFKKLSDIGIESEHAFDDSSVVFKETDLGSYVSAFEVFPDDTLMCMRVINMTANFRKEQETKKFNNQAELFKIVVEFKAGQ